MWLTRLALRNPVLILMLSLMTIVLGSVSLQRLSVDLFPDITVPVIRVATFYNGAGPGDIEKSITQPIERAVSASPGVEAIVNRSMVTSKSKSSRRARYCTGSTTRRLASMPSTPRFLM